MSKDNGRWLRAQRRARAWNVPKMAHELRAVADATGDKVPTVATMEAHVRRWERGVVDPSERYMLYYCKAFGIRADQYGPGGDAGQPDPGRQTAGSGADGAAVTGVTFTSARPAPAAAIGGPSARHPAGRAGIAAWPPGSAWLASGDVADRWVQEPGPGGAVAGREVLTAAHESSGQAERAERRDIGEVTLEQVRADVVRVSRAYMTGQPLVLFFEMRRVRDRMHAALERRLWPRDTTDVYFLLGAVNCLMATAAKVLGYPPAASELERAGQAYAAGIGNRPLMARLRLASAQTAYLYGRPRQAADLASGAVQCLPGGPNAASFHLVHAQAAARLGDADTARAAIAAAGDAREGEHQDDLLAIGGEFGFSQASQHFFAGAALVQIPGAESDAIGELECAIKMYADGPGPGEDHSDQCRVAAHIDLAAARLRAGRLDAAIAAIEPVMAVPPGLRTEVVSQRLAVVRAELAQPIYRGSPQAKEAGERIGEFCRDSIVAELHDLPDGPA